MLTCHVSLKCDRPLQTRENYFDAYKLKGETNQFFDFVSMPPPDYWNTCLFLKTKTQTDNFDPKMVIVSHAYSCNNL